MIQSYTPQGRKGDVANLEPQYMDIIADGGVQKRYSTEAMTEILWKERYPLAPTQSEIGKEQFENNLLEIAKANGFGISSERSMIGDFFESKTELLSWLPWFKDQYIMRGDLAMAFFIAFSASGSMASVRSIFQDKKLTRTDVSDPESDKQKRVTDRCTAASLVCSLFFGGVNAFVDAKTDVNSATSTALLGMFMSGCFGFLGDNIVGTDEAFDKCKVSLASAVTHSMQKLASPSFLRFMGTTMLDMFVTLILFKPLFSSIVKLPWFRKNNTTMAMGNGLVSTLIGAITIYAYAGSTRVQWAYAKKKSENTIQGTTMQIALAISSLVYLTSNTRMHPGDPGINDPSVKVWVTMGVMAYLTLMGKMGWVEPGGGNAKGSEWTGITIYAVICAVTFGGTLATSKLKSSAAKLGWFGLFFSIMFFPFIGLMLQDKYFERHVKKT